MSHTCLHCSTVYEGNFCPHCGQKSSTHRITFKTIAHDIPHSVFHIDKGVFYTFWQMLYKPGVLARDYVAGKRVNYFSPFAYVFLLSAVSTFVIHTGAEYLHIRFSGHVDGALFPVMAGFFSHYPALMLCALVPFIAFWSWIFNRDSGYNYWENFILNTYLIAQFNVVYLLFLVSQISGWYRSANMTPVILLFLAYITFAYRQFFIPTGRRPYIRNIIMFLCIGFTFITGLVFAGFMTPWWNIFN